MDGKKSGMVLLQILKHVLAVVPTSLLVDIREGKCSFFHCAYAHFTLFLKFVYE